MSASDVGLPEVHLKAGLGEHIATQLRQVGYVVVCDALDEAVTTALAKSFWSRQGFDIAGVGRDDNFLQTAAIRSDRIQWIDGDDAATAWFLDWAELARAELNQRLFLGLFEYECHYAWYEQGASYDVHLDAFRGESNRVLSTVLYLNDGWKPGDGGELIIYKAIEADRGLLGPVETIVAPEFGTLVVFLSEDFPHEVVASQRDRASIAGWFRVNTSSSTKLDPPHAR